VPVGLFSIYWVNDLQATDVWIGLRGTVGSFALVIGYFFWGRMANRIGHRRMLIICGAGQACYPVLTALAPDPVWLLPAAFVAGITAGGIDLGLFDMLLGACPEGRQPTFAAGSAVFTSIAVTIGPLLGAALAQSSSTRTALFIIGAAQAVATLGFLLLPSREQENHES
jgi:MFS family permease